MTQLVTWGQLELPWVSALSPSVALTLTPDGTVKNNAERNTTATFIPHIESPPCWLSIWAVEIEAAAPASLWFALQLYSRQSDHLQQIKCCVISSKRRNAANPITTHSAILVPMLTDRFQLPVSLSADTAAVIPLGEAPTRSERRVAKARPVVLRTLEEVVCRLFQTTQTFGRPPYVRPVEAIESCKTALG
ncbi:hypothetical protein SRHO_G00209670 [Serrasalmus rhombeus]